MMDLLSRQYISRYSKCRNLRDVVMESSRIHSGDIQLARRQASEALARALAAEKRAEFLSKELDTLVLQVAAYKLNERKLLEKQPC